MFVLLLPCILCPFFVIFTMFRGGRGFRDPVRLSLILQESQMMVYD